MQELPHTKVSQLGFQGLAFRTPAITGQSCRGRLGRSTGIPCFSVWKILLSSWKEMRAGLSQGVCRKEVAGGAV